MKLDELKKLCQEQIALYEKMGLSGQPEVALKQPGRRGRTDYRLFMGVKGEIVRDNFGDGMVVMYPARELLFAISQIREEE